MEDSSVRSNSRKLTRYCVFFFLLFPACSSNPATKKQIRDAKDSIVVSPPKDTAVNMVPVDAAFTYDSTKTYIYLTLDDGPQKGTMNCYNILKALDVKASFFMIGVHVDNDYDRREVDQIRSSYPMFLLCNHSYTHANYNHYHAYYNNPDSALRDFQKNEQNLNVPVKIVRTPGNSSWVVSGRIRAPTITKPLCHLFDSAGYSAAGWDVEWRFRNGDIPVESANRMINIVDQYARSKDLFKAKHVVILAHDRMFGQQNYADSLQKFIGALKANPHYVFETIDHYPGMKGK